MTPTSPASMTPSPPATATPSTQAPPRAATGPIAALGANDRAAPPHPFRSSPWYDPRVVDPAPKPAPRDHRIASRVTLVVLGGIVMPIVSLVINARLHVVSLRAAGIVLVAASTLVPLAHLIWLPLRRARRGTKGHIEAPRSTLALIALLVAGLLSALLWAYLGVLFLPMIPLSVV
ncbi:MAG: hypothetical protein KAI47_22450, partial [Deltaproteobacteria bacterium]|nr:hypothetical protein [Deltaproteobacteria bacterium]